MTASPDDRTAQVDETEIAPQKASAKRAPTEKQTPSAASAEKTTRTPAAKKPAAKAAAAKKPAATTAAKTTAAKRPAAKTTTAKTTAAKATAAKATNAKTTAAKAAAEKAAPTSEVVVEPLKKALADAPTQKRTAAVARTAATKNTAARTAATRSASSTAARTATARAAETAAAGAPSTKSAAAKAAAAKSTAAKAAAAKSAAAKSAAAKSAAAKSTARSASAKTAAAKTAAAKAAATKARAAEAKAAEAARADAAAAEAAEAEAVASAAVTTEAATAAAAPLSASEMPVTEAETPVPDVDVIEQVFVAEVEPVVEESAEPALVEEPEPVIEESVEVVEAVAEPEDTAGEAVGPVRGPSAGEAISIRGLVKHFGDNRAVDGIDLTVPAGSFYGVVGPNGAGKTTTLSIVAGLLRADEGRVVICGIDQAAEPQAAKRLMGVLPDRLRTFDRLTGRQLLYYYGLLRGLAADVIEKRAADLARAFDLGDALSRVVSDYSAGMTKKIMLAGAMIHSPRVLVLDEPFESVDPVSSAVILDILRAYVSHGGTVILSSHGMDLVERVCSRVAIIVSGEVLAEGTIDEVRAGQTLEARFVELAGSSGEVEGLEWLHTFSD